MMSESIQREVLKPKPQLTLAEEVASAVERLRHYELSPRYYQSQLRTELAIVRSKLVLEGIPEGSELEAGMILAVKDHPELEQGHSAPNLLAKLKEIDGQVRGNRGQTVLWLSEEPNVDSPHKQDKSWKYFINLGILTEDSKIEIDSSGQLSIPLDSSVNVQIRNKFNDLPDLGSKEIAVQIAQDLNFEVKKQRDIQIPLRWLLDNIHSKREFISIGNEAVDTATKELALDKDLYFIRATEQLLKTYLAGWPDKTEASSTT